MGLFLLCGVCLFSMNEACAYSMNGNFIRKNLFDLLGGLERIWDLSDSVWFFRKWGVETDVSEANDHSEEVLFHDDGVDVVERVVFDTPEENAVSVC